MALCSAVQGEISDQSLMVQTTYARQSRDAKPDHLSSIEGSNSGTLSSDKSVSHQQFWSDSSKDDCDKFYKKVMGGEERKSEQEWLGMTVDAVAQVAVMSIAEEMPIIGIGTALFSGVLGEYFLDDADSERIGNIQQVTKCLHTEMNIMKDQLSQNTKKIEALAETVLHGKFSKLTSDMEKLMLRSKRIEFCAIFHECQRDDSIHKDCTLYKAGKGPYGSASCEWAMFTETFQRGKNGGENERWLLGNMVDWFAGLANMVGLDGYKKDETWMKLIIRAAQSYLLQIGFVHSAFKSEAKHFCVTNKCAKLHADANGGASEEVVNQAYRNMLEQVVEFANAASAFLKKARSTSDKRVSDTNIMKREVCCLNDKFLESAEDVIERRRRAKLVNRRRADWCPNDVFGCRQHEFRCDLPRCVWTKFSTECKQAKPQCWGKGTTCGPSPTWKKCKDADCMLRRRTSGRIYHRRREGNLNGWGCHEPALTTDTQEDCGMATGDHAGLICDSSTPTCVFEEKRDYMETDLEVLSTQLDTVCRQFSKNKCCQLTKTEWGKGHSPDHDTPTLKVVDAKYELHPTDVNSAYELIKNQKMSEHTTKALKSCKTEDANLGLRPATYDCTAVRRRFVYSGSRRRWQPAEVVNRRRAPPRRRRAPRRRRRAPRRRRSGGKR